jgi:UDP-3-O-[3-hydroxymyristoyl] glucosamine N-acyltransferase
MGSQLMQMSCLSWGGTWISSLHYRALGATMGRRVSMPPSTVFEPDLLVVGNDASVGSGLCAEYGVTLKDSSTITNSCVVDAGCTIGTGALLVSCGCSLMPPGIMLLDV